MTSRTLGQWIFGIAMFLVIAGHFAFAYLQWFDWEALTGRLTKMSPDSVAEAAFLGRSIASYNAAIGLGLLLSLKLEARARFFTQAVVLACIVVTAVVGAMGTEGPSILIARLAPAAFALAALLARGAPKRAAD